jgi:hypothetical protein
VPDGSPVMLSWSGLWGIIGRLDKPMAPVAGERRVCGTKAKPLVTHLAGGFAVSELCLTNPPLLRPNCRLCANPDHDPHWASYSDPRLGSGCGASAVSITRRWLARSRLFGGGRTLQAISCALPHDALVAAEKAQPSNDRAGPAITSASIHFRPASPTKCVRSIGGECWANDTLRLRKL